MTENLQDHIRCLQHATQRAWTREFNDWCAVNHKTPTTGQEVCTLVDEFLEATPEKPHKKQLKLLGRFLCQRETLFTNYNQGMRCQWCKTPQSSEMLLSLLYPTADWNADCARFCYNCMTNQDDHYPLIPGSWLHDEWDMRDPTNHSEQYTNMACWKDHKPTNWMVAVPDGDYLSGTALLLHQWDEASFTWQRLPFHDPTMNSSSRTRPFAEVTFRASETHVVLKLQHFALRLSTQISPNTVPATKSDTPTSPNTAPATKNDAHH